MMNLEKLAIEDLQQLLINVPKELERRLALQRASCMEELAALAKARGFVLAELVREAANNLTDVKVPVAAQRRPAPVKFRHPQNSKLAWSGRGRQPNWVQTFLAEGRMLEELVV